jgi:thioredoxin 1
MDERDFPVKSVIAVVGACVVLIAAPLRSQKSELTEDPQKPKVTFVELGSVKCLPCRQMQPVMKAIEERYAGLVKVVFYDVWKEDQQHHAGDYKIRVIPTQVFLDDNGRELMRHEGFFPEKDIDAFLQSKGLKPNTAVKD